MNELKENRPKTIYKDSKSDRILGEILHYSSDSLRVRSSLDGKAYLVNGRGQLINPTKIRGKAEVKRLKRERMKNRKERNGESKM